MSVLTEQALSTRLRDGSLVITPLLDPPSQVRDGSVNIRLGTRFIVSHRSQLPLIDPEKLDVALVRKFFSKLHLEFGQTFVLHPGHVALAGTFEFIAFPSDICAYVLSRSKYGRIGLLVATATYVHPRWRGCLTLELVNAGEAPIKLTCGAPIAQLVMHSTTPADDNGRRATRHSVVPTGPEFLALSTDHDWNTLARFRRSALPDMEA